jgi:Asp-tRNA(Asn)/Glu-tRNA(Gln) amidotransferase A subunit family amidase
MLTSANPLIFSRTDKLLIYSWDQILWTSLATCAGLPAAVAPVGVTRGGLPVGIQIIGPYPEDRTVTDVARRPTDLVGAFQPPRAFATANRPGRCINGRLRFARYEVAIR